jgi:hypothetical protein
MHRQNGFVAHFQFHLPDAMASFRNVAPGAAVAGAAVKLMRPVLEESIRQAAQGSAIHADDTGIGDMPPTTRAREAFHTSLRTQSLGPVWGGRRRLIQQG